MTKIRKPLRHALAETFDELSFNPHSGWVDGTSALNAMGAFDNPGENPKDLSGYFDLFLTRNMPIGETSSSWIVRWSDAYELIRESKGADAARKFTEQSLGLGSIDEWRYTRASSPQLCGIMLTPHQIKKASEALSSSNLTVEGGRFLKIEGYQNFDILAKFNLEHGDPIYFASKRYPFGDVYGSYSPANQHSRDLTGFGTDFSDDYPQYVEARKIYEEYRKQIDA